MERQLSDLLNQFGICECCKQHNAIRNESVYCETCFDHEEECNLHLYEAFDIISRVVEQLAQKYKNDPEFWNILLGK